MSVTTRDSALPLGAAPAGAGELPQRTHAFRTLDGLRGIAAVCVSAHHLPSLIGGPVFGGSYLAVDLFFLMSGFVISHAYDAKLQQGLGPAGFMRIRLIRLFPLYAIGTGMLLLWTAMAIATGHSEYWNWSSLLVALPLALLILPAPPHNGVGSSDLLFFNPPAWSLFWELAINLVYAVLFRPLQRRGVVPALIVLSAIVLGALAWSDGKLDQGALWSDAPGGAARVTFSFFLGVQLFRLHREGKLPRPQIPAWCILLVSVPILVVSGEGTWRACYDLACILLLFPLLLIAAVANEPKAKAMTSFCIASGAISYALYVVHIPIEMSATSVLERLHIGRSALVHEILSLVIALCVAGFLARFIDPWARSALKRLTSRGSAAPKDGA